MKQKILGFVWDVIKTAIGCALFGLGFNLFLMPNGMNIGGLSGIAMIVVHLTGFGTGRVFTILMNIP